MNNEELIKKLIDEKRGKAKEADSVLQTENEKILVFRKNQDKYAFYARDIKEIIINSDFFYVPFVPPYIRGLINRHGEPYTVIDVQALFDGDITDDSKFLIMNIDDDQLAIMITDIVEITNISRDQLHKFQSTDSENKYFSASFTDKANNEIFIINLSKIREKLENDIN